MVKEEEHDEGENTAAMMSNSKKVTLPNRQTFYARYERTSRRNLPKNITMTKNRRIRPRQGQARKIQQGGSVLGNIVKLQAKKWKNESFEFESDVANYFVEEIQKKATEDLNNLFGGYKKWLWVSVIFKLKKHLKI